jgi:hypothetical protein
MDEETGWFNVQLFADVFADLDQILAAQAAGSTLGFMAMLDARQMLRQWLTTGTLTRGPIGRHGGLAFLLLGQFGQGRCQIAGQRFLEQITLFGGQRFAAGAETHPAQVGQFKNQRLNLGLGGVQLGVAASDLPMGFGGVFLCLIDEFLNRADDPFREFRSGV